MIDVLNRRISRRTFLKASAAVGGTIAASQLIFSNAAQAAMYGENEPDSVTGGTVKYIRTTCMMCNSVCGQQVKTDDGIAVKCSGNPYSPQNNDDFLNLTGTGNLGPANVTEALRQSGGRMCAKGQAAIMTLYSPYRLTRPLKRVGARGAGRWQVISWLEAVNSICLGHKDASLTTEATLPNASAAGNYSIYAQGASLAQIRDTAWVKANGLPGPGYSLGFSAMPSGDVHPDIRSVSSAYAAYVGGPAANRVLTVRGRTQWSHEAWRLLKDGFGSKNDSGHEAMCNSSYKRAGQEMVMAEGWKPNMLSTSGTTYTGPTYVILFGADYNEAVPPHVAIARYLADFRRRGGQLVYTDVRVSQTAAKADTRLIVNPGTDGALALGIAKQWFDDGTIATGYLSCPTSAQLNNLDGRAAGACMTPDAGSLIFTTGPDVGKRVGSAAAGNAGMYFIESVTSGVKLGSAFVAAERATLEPGTITSANLVASGVAASGDAQTAYEIYKSYVATKTVAQWAAECGLTTSAVSGVAQAAAAAASSGRLGIDFARGCYAHTNGLYAARAAYSLGILQDAMNRAGGTGKSSDMGGASTPATSGGTAVAATPSGIDQCRKGATFGYMGTSGLVINDPMGLTSQPRQWYPWANHNVFSEIYPSAAEGYPYKVKAIFSHGSNSAGYTLGFSQGSTNSGIEQLKKHGLDRVYNVPLVVDVKTCMDESAAHADFVLPEVTYLERWSDKKENGYGGIASKISGIRRPVVGTYTSGTIAGRTARMYLSPFASLASSGFGGDDEAFLGALDGPLPLEDIQIQLGKKLGLKGYGLNGISSVGPKHLDTAKQYYDEAFSTSGLSADGNDGTPSVFCTGGDGATSGTVITNNALFMGGAYTDPSNNTAGGWCKYGLKSGSAYLIPKDDANANHLRMAINKTDFSSVPSGYANWAAVWDDIKKVLLPYHKPACTDLDPLSETLIADNGYDLSLATYKAAWHTQSRTTENVWLVTLTGRDRTSPGTVPRDPNGLPTVWINPTTAAAKGISDAQRVLVTSALNTRGFVARANVTGAVRAGSVVLDHHYGRKWFGSGYPDHRYKAGTAGVTHTATVGKAIPDRRMAVAGAFGAVSRCTQRNNVNYNTCLVDPISVQVAYMSGKVKVSPIG
ncbi:MAG: molybdopterin-dependent oxidoreductase [Actinomycetota bacterium]|nr:molybdopterin-dependent oxidoreductase [Actinomycetota bacterium]